MELRSLPEVAAVFERFFPHDGFSDSQREVIEQLLREATKP